jgi:hypothetical protein
VAGDPDADWFVQLHFGPPAGFLSKRLPAGTYAWQRRAPDGDRRAEGTVTVEPGKLAIVDAR